MALRKRDLYRMPWSLNDNPIGWLETTDQCNLFCRGCYRKPREGHVPLQRLKEDIDFFKEWRNCDNISVAGGEPLVHPEIVDIIAYIREKGMKPVLITNAHALDLPFLKELKKAGLAGFNLHIDQEQERPGWEGSTEIDLMELRQHFADMIDHVKNVHASFGMTVYPSNFEYLPDIVRWARQHWTKIDGLVFIAFRSLPTVDDIQFAAGGQEIDGSSLQYSSDDTSEINITSLDVYQLIHDNFPEYEPSGYLGGTTHHASYKWLLSGLIGTKSKVYGSFGPKTMEFFQTMHHLLAGSYVTYMENGHVGRKIFHTALFDPVMRRTYFNWLKSTWWNPIRFFEPIYLQTIGIIQAPDILSDGSSDMCDSCPDMAVYNGTLVNSCRMDELREFGEFVKPVFKERDKAEELEGIKSRSKEFVGTYAGKEDEEEKTEK